MVRQLFLRSPHERGEEVRAGNYKRWMVVAKQGRRFEISRIVWFVCP